MNWTTGNRECGFLSKDQWDQKLSEPISLSPEEIRQDLEFYLKSANRAKCQDNSKEGEQTVSSGQDTEQDSLPTIDLFLNPNRSKELEGILRKLENREDSVAQTKVIILQQ